MYYQKVGVLEAVTINTQSSCLDVVIDGRVMHQAVNWFNVVGQYEKWCRHLDEIVRVYGDDPQHANAIEPIQGSDVAYDYLKMSLAR